LIIHIPQNIRTILNRNLIPDLLGHYPLDLLISLIDIFVPIVQQQQLLDTLLDLHEHEPELLVALVRHDASEHFHVDVFAGVELDTLHDRGTVLDYHRF
jgi:hypothetical protein